jgi:hypothetical protein
VHVNGAAHEPRVGRQGQLARPRREQRPDDGDNRDSDDCPEQAAACHLQSVVKVTASTEDGEAPRGQGATTENIGPYLKKQQRSPRACIAGRMPS